MGEPKLPVLEGQELSDMLNRLSDDANPGPYGVNLYGSGSAWLTLGTWVGHYASDTVPMMGGGMAQIVNSNVPSEWGDRCRNQSTAKFLKELANAWRDGRIVVADMENSERS